MGKFSTSMSLFSRSFSVILKNKTLLLFPVMGLIFFFVIGVFYFSPLMFVDTGHSLADQAHWIAIGQRVDDYAENREYTSSIIGYGWFFVAYLSSMFCATFLNVAFYNEIINALNGNKVSIARGLKTAISKIKLIIIWSLFAGAVGMIIKTLEERLGFIGRWILRLIGVAWSAASIFAIPVIIREEKSSNPVKMLKTSALMLKKTWSEAVIGYIGISGIFFGCFLVSLPLFIIALLTAGVANPELVSLVIVFILYALFLFTFAFFISAAEDVYKCALYMYASEGVVPGPYDEELMKKAWKVKKAKKK